RGHVGDVVEAAPEAEVLDGAELRVDERIVGQDADRGPDRARRVQPADVDPPRARPDQRRQDADQRRLAGAVRPHERGPAPRAQPDRDPAERALPAVELGDALDEDARDHGRAWFGAGVSRSSSSRWTSTSLVMIAFRWTSKT